MACVRVCGSRIDNNLYESRWSKDNTFEFFQLIFFTTDKHLFQALEMTATPKLAFKLSNLLLHYR
jgi:hypothetical protein